MRQLRGMPDDNARSLDPLTEEALAWLVRLHSGEESEDDWQRYHDWKAETPANRDASRRAEDMWSRLGPALRRKGTPPIAGIVAAAILVGAALAYTGAFGRADAWLADEATGIGERRVVKLADATEIVLDAVTSFDVRYSPTERRIVLRDGQIYATVAPEPGRPFVVEANGGSVRALGTQFNVRMNDDGARVAVTEHAVRVSYGANPGVTVAAGQGVGYERRSGLGVPSAVDANAISAWRRGEVIFDNKPLGEVVDDMHRYGGGTAVFTDAHLKELPVTGVFSTSEVDAFYAALEGALPVRVTRLPLITVISRAN